MLENYLHLVKASVGKRVLSLLLPPINMASDRELVPLRRTMPIPELVELGRVVTPEFHLNRTPTMDMG